MVLKKLEKHHNSLRDNILEDLLRVEMQISTLFLQRILIGFQKPVDKEIKIWYLIIGFEKPRRYL